MFVRFLRWLFSADEETIYSFSLTKDDEQSYHLHWPTNTISLHWYWFKRRLGFTFRIDETDDETILLWVAIPYLISVYLHIGRMQWLVKLLGMAREPGMPLRRWSDLRREIGFSFAEGGVLIYPWVNGNDPAGRDCIYINFADALLGRAKYSERNQRVKHTIVTMPEGSYEATVKLYQAIRKRPRWPWPDVVHRAEIEVERGIPIPSGDGDLSYDMEDDAIFSMTTTARTFREASIKMYEGVMRDRVRRAAANWQPAQGWPPHCLRQEAH